MTETPCVKGALLMFFNLVKIAKERIHELNEDRKQRRRNSLEKEKLIRSCSSSLSELTEEKLEKLRKSAPFDSEARFVLSLLFIYSSKFNCRKLKIFNPDPLIGASLLVSAAKSGHKEAIWFKENDPKIGSLAQVQSRIDNSDNNTWNVFDNIGDWFSGLLMLLIFVFVVAGIAGILLFGIRQLI